MSRDPRYQRLLNDKRWAEVKAIVWKRANGLCEQCLQEGIARGTEQGPLDCHHINPVESGRNEAEMEALCYNPDNIRLLCVPHHIEVHAQMKSHTKAKVRENKARARERFRQANDPNYVPSTEEATG